MKCKAFSLILLLITSNLFAVNIDSLKALLSSKKKKDFIAHSLDIGKYSFQQGDGSDSLIKYSQMAFKVAIEIKDTTGMINSLTYLGIGYTKKNNYKKSTNLWHRALKLAQKQKDYRSIADLYNKLGYNYHIQDKYKLAIQQYIKSAEAFEKLGDFEGLGTNYISIAMIFGGMDQNEECLKYVKKAIRVAPKIDDEYSQVIVYSGALAELSEISYDKKEYLDSALIYADKALQISIKNNYPEKIGLIYLELCGIYFAKKDVKKATSYFKLAQNYPSFFTKINLIRYYLRGIDVMETNQQLSSAILYFDSVTTLLQTEPDDFYQMEAYRRAYHIYKTLGNHQQSLFYYELLYDLEKKDEKVNKTKEINELQEKYNKSQNEKQIEKLKLEKDILQQQEEISQLRIRNIIILSALVVMVLLVTLFVYRQKVIKNQLRLIESEMRLNRSRMDPHFFFNVLSSIQTLSLHPDKQKVTASYLAKFAKIMRISLESSYQEMVSLSDEIEFLTKYLEIQNFYRGDSFQFTIETDSTLNSDAILIPSMLLQPFIENSIEHGFKNSIQTGLLKISFSLEDGKMIIEQQDNGIWQESEEKEQLAKYPSRALQIVKERLDLFNKRYHKKTSLTIVTNKTGTKIRIELPIFTSDEMSDC